jgi:hypothetical protein
MWPAFPTSDYYEDSVPPRAISQRQACPPTPWLGIGEGDTEAVPPFTLCRSTGAAQLFPCSLATGTPQAFPVASPPASSFRLRSRQTGQAGPTCTAGRPVSTRFEPVPRLRGFHRWFLHSYTFPSRLPDPARLAIPDRPGVVRAAPALPCVFRIRLPSASPVCCDRPEVGSYPPPGQVAPRGAG